jgi:hypothetical protein
LSISEAGGRSSEALAILLLVEGLRVEGVRRRSNTGQNRQATSADTMVFMIYLLDLI